MCISDLPNHHYYPKQKKPLVGTRKTAAKGKREDFLGLNAQPARQILSTHGGGEMLMPAGKKNPLRESKEDKEAQLIEYFMQKSQDQLKNSIVFDVGLKRSLSPELAEGAEKKPAFSYVPSMAGGILHPIREAQPKGGQRPSVALYQGVKDGTGTKNRSGKAHSVMKGP